MYGRLIPFACALLLGYCAPIPPPSAHPSQQPQASTTWLVDAVACQVAGPIPYACQTAVPNASVQMHGPDGYITKTSDGAGYAVFTLPSNFPDSDVIIDAPGYLTARAHIDVAGTHDSARHNIIILKPAFPAPPSRADLLNVKMAFQGLTVHTGQFGDLPWFEAALPWLNAADRQSVYAAKKASQAWDGGDTHAIAFLPHGPPLYDEPGQPYSADRFPALDWTCGDTCVDPQFVALVAEEVRAGFKVLLFLGGDDAEPGYVVATKELPLVASALQNSAFGDLRQYVVILPGWDGVFYGYTPQHIHDWGAQCRSLMPYCGLEHSTGHIPAGDGPGEWGAPSGPMRSYDLLLSEFDDDRFDDSVWQIAARMLGPVYKRPSDQPSSDDPDPPFYLKDPTDRGPIVNCAFEFWEYGWVRGASVARVTAARNYFKNIGYGCGG